MIVLLGFIFYLGITVKCNELKNKNITGSEKDREIKFIYSFVNLLGWICAISLIILIYFQYYWLRKANENPKGFC
jgi:hypothetical protein